jgi:hypothetical protein
MYSSQKRTPRVALTERTRRYDAKLRRRVISIKQLLRERLRPYVDVPVREALHMIEVESAKVMLSVANRHRKHHHRVPKKRYRLTFTKDALGKRQLYTPIHHLFRKMIAWCKN